MPNQTRGLARAPVALKGARSRHLKPSDPLRHYYKLVGAGVSLHSGHGVKTRTNTHNKQPNTHALRGDETMASASVVGPHRLDSEPQLRRIKLSGSRKKTPRKLSWEKMVFRRSSGSSGESVTTEGEPGTHPLSPGPAGEMPLRGGVMPAEGCGAPAAPAAPRSPNRDRQAGSSTDGDWHAAAETRESVGAGAGHISSDCNSNVDCDSNRNTGGRRGTSLKRSGINVMPNGAVINGHKGGAHRHRDAPHGRRDTWSGDSRQRPRQSISSSGSAQGESSGPPLERVTQGRTGVVRLARTEPARREAWSIFPRGVDPRVRTERGEGHRFEAKPVTQDWCDACSRQITAQALKCQSKYL